MDRAEYDALWNTGHRLDNLCREFFQELARQAHDTEHKERAGLDTRAAAEARCGEPVEESRRNLVDRLSEMGLISGSGAAPGAVYFTPQGTRAYRFLHPE